MRMKAVILSVTLALPSTLAAAMGGLYGIREANSVVFLSPDSRLVAFSYGTLGSPIKLVDLGSGEVRHEFANKGDVSGLDFSPDGRLPAAGITLSVEPTKGEITVWDTGAGVTKTGLRDLPAFYFVKFLSQRTIVYLEFDQRIPVDGTVSCFNENEPPRSPRNASLLSRRVP